MTYCTEAWPDADGTRTHYCNQTGPHDTHWCGICGPDCTPPDDCEDGMSERIVFEGKKAGVEVLVYRVKSVNGEEMEGVRAVSDGTHGFCSVGGQVLFWADSYVANASPAR